MKIYLDDNRDTFPPARVSQYDPTVRENSAADYNLGNHLGGNDPLPDPAFAGTPPATNRVLNPYVPARGAWRCPADRGLFDRRPTVFAAVGNSYRFNRGVDGDYQFTGVVDDPFYNLGLKKENWPPQPARFILMNEFAAYPWEGDYVTSWDGASNPGKMYTGSTIKQDPDKLISPVLFVDGHCLQCDFTATMKKSLMHGLEPGKDWLWYKPRK